MYEACRTMSDCRYSDTQISDMKKNGIVLVLLIVCLLMLSSCKLLRSDHTTYFSREHEEPDNTRNAVVSGINSYDTLCKAMEDVIAKVQTEVSLVVVNYDGNLHNDLDKLSEYITGQYPLGIYGVSSVNFTTSFITTYCMVETKITYSKPYEDMRGIVQVISDDEMCSLFCSMIRSRDLHRAYYLSGCDLTSDDLHRVFYKAWCESGYYAYGVKDVSITLYQQENSQSCVIDVNMSLIDSILDTEDTVKKTVDASQMVVHDCAYVETEDKVRYVLEWIKNSVYYDAYATEEFNDVQGDMPKMINYTASGALLNGSASQSGITIAASVMLEELGVKNQVICGLVDGQQYFWLALYYGGQMRFVDVSAFYGSQYDECIIDIASAKGRYKWDESLYSFN